MGIHIRPVIPHHVSGSKVHHLRVVTMAIVTETRHLWIDTPYFDPDVVTAFLTKQVSRRFECHAQP